MELFTADKTSGGGGGAAGGAGGAAGGTGGGGVAGAAADAVHGAGIKSALVGLEDLWDENQYKEEFALDGFIKSLNTKK